MIVTSLKPRLTFRGRGKRAWYTLSAHAQSYRAISSIIHQILSLPHVWTRYAGSIPFHGPRSTKSFSFKTDEG